MCVFIVITLLCPDDAILFRRGRMGEKRKEYKRQYKRRVYIEEYNMGVKVVRNGLVK